MGFNSHQQKFTIQKFYLNIFINIKWVLISFLGINQYYDVPVKVNDLIKDLIEVLTSWKKHLNMKTLGI